MKLKPQPPVRRRATASARPRRGGFRLRRPGGGRQASRPTISVRRRLSTRLPSIRRLLAGVGAGALAAMLVALISGPWLRIGEVGWHGQRYATESELEDVLDAALGVSALAVDTRAIAERLEQLPSVADARVEVSLTGRVDATVTEPVPAFVWETRHGRFLGSADGTLFVELQAGDQEPSTSAMPHVEDRRFAARVLTVGDIVPDALVRVALRLSDLDPAALGTTATRLSIAVDDDVGFRLSSPQQSWEIALGVYGRDPNETIADADARLDRQVAAVRTLFAARPEAELAWVDVRNPGKVYFRAKG
jgi:cell division protein FtsQ